MGSLFRNVVYPAYHWAKRDGVNRAIREFERNQWLSRSDVLALQQRKLASLLSFVSKNVPYYRTLLQDMDFRDGQTNATDEIRRLPLLTKSIIRREQDALVSEDLSGNGLLANSTSGSTGEAIHFYTDFRSIAYRKAAGIRSDSWTGWRLGERYISLWGAAMDVKRVRALRGRLHGILTGRRLLSSFDLSTSRMDEYVEIIRKFQPILFLSYPGPLEKFASHCGERGVAFPSIKGIVTSAETLWPHQREAAERAFGTRVFNRYGSREVGQIGSECETHAGLHISADRLLIEVVDEGDKPCPAGEAGRIVVTDLDNFGMPLIRYDIGDRGAWADSRACGCGRGLPLLETIEGRTMDIIRTPGGRQLGGTFWTLMLKTRPGLRQIQVVQERLEGVVIKFIRDIDFDEDVLDYFTVKIQEYCGGDFSVEFIETDSIDLTVSGKQRLIVSLLASEGESSAVQKN
jgi:phenylacetate-CoA ligase